MKIFLPTDKLKTNKERLDWIEDAIFASRLNFYLTAVALTFLLVWMAYMMSEHFSQQPKVPLLPPVSTTVKGAQ